MTTRCASRSSPFRTACLIAAAAAVLLGCSAASRSPPPPPPPPVNLAGFSAAFRDGYAAGCDSANARTTRRDEARFKTDRQYASGWRDGFDACGRTRRPQ
jgi:hypothetical protein